jgi:hypothetical protein
MSIKKPTLEDYVDAIITRDGGMPYEEVLNLFNLIPNQFNIAVTRNLDDYIILTRGKSQKQLIEIAENSERKQELFHMSEKFIERQYDAIMAGKQSILFRGTLEHPENIRVLAYYALTSHNPQLASKSRIKVIKAIKELPSRLEKYMHTIELGGLMTSALNGSPLALLELFDEVYQRKTGDSSLFDLSQKQHLHRWGGDFKAPQSYWRDQANAEEAIYHALTEHNPKLASQDRKKVVAAVKRLPSNLQSYLYSIGLNGVMMNAFREGERDSPLAVLMLFDKVYQDKTGDSSLFNLSRKYHLHRWGDEFCAQRSYWQNQSNVEEAVYHTLAEYNHQMASRNREKAVTAFKKLPSNLRKYFYSIGMGGLMRIQRDSPALILQIFDQAYQKITGNQSLFDDTQDIYLKFDSKKRLVV